MSDFEYDTVASGRPMTADEMNKCASLGWRLVGFAIDPVTDDARFLANRYVYIWERRTTR